jgi:iron complex transport system substrate-binding protein
MRIISLLPSATEIVAALGVADRLVGISHECDHPREIANLPRVTRCEIHGMDLRGEDIDRWVRETLAARGTLYTLDEDRVRALQPDVVLTQQLCDVCAVSYGSVAAFAASLPTRPRVLNLQPATLQDILVDVEQVAAALGVPERGADLVASLRQRIDAVARATAGAARRPGCFLLEWVEPPYCGGHWNPQLVDLAGGRELIGRSGQPSRRVSWDEIAGADPEVVVLALCGFALQRTLNEAARLGEAPQWRRLRAVREGRVYAVDANACFSRPGPRIVDSLELLAHILHPDCVVSPPRGTDFRALAPASVAA